MHPYLARGPNSHNSVSVEDMVRVLHMANPYAFLDCVVTQIVPGEITATVEAIYSVEGVPLDLTDYPGLHKKSLKFTNQCIFSVERRWSLRKIYTSGIEMAKGIGAMIIIFGLIAYCSGPVDESCRAGPIRGSEICD